MSPGERMVIEMRERANSASYYRDIARLTAPAGTVVQPAAQVQKCDGGAWVQALIFVSDAEKLN